MKLHTCLFFIFFSLQIGYSQTHIYKNFGVDNGLPSSEIYDVYQDKEGYVWFATDKGLSRFNGYEFENFTTKDGLPDNTIFDFHVQENGQVWCYGYQSQKLFYFNEVFDGFKTYKFNNLLKSKLKIKTVLKSIVVDNDKTVFAGGYGLCGLIQITDSGQFIPGYDSNPNPEFTYSERNINLGLKTNNNAFFVICDTYFKAKDFRIINTQDIPSGKLEVKQLDKNQYLFIDQKLGLASKNGQVSYFKTLKSPIGIKPIDTKTFFVGYYKNGVEIRNVTGKIIESFLPKKSVSSFLIDKEGGYWFTTLDDGVFYFKNPEIRTLTNEHISSLVKNNEEQLFAGYNNGNITSINTTKKIDTLYTALNEGQAYVEFDRMNNHLYGYSDAKLINYTTQKQKAYGHTRKLSEHITNPILKSSMHSYIKIENDSMATLSVDKNIHDVSFYKNSVLIGTSSGLFIQKENDSIVNQRLDILKVRIDDIDVNKNTNIAYMATQGSGVVVYGDSIYNINKAKGLTNDIVSEIHIENDSIIWACTNTGLNRIYLKNNNKYSINTITKADGLLSNDIDDIEIIDDTIWVATKKGLCYFNKAIIAKKEDSKIISLTLKNVEVNKHSINKENVKLKYDQNDISFSLQAVSHRNTNNINYLYRLKEIDTNWIITRNRNISFPSLSPGNYTFEAKANVSNNRNDFFVKYSFKIQPPYWKSYWFYSICMLLVAGLVYLFFKIRVLSYNQDVFRELIRLIIKQLKRKEQFYKFKSNGEDFKIPTYEIQYIHSHGNYLDLITHNKTYTIRYKIGDFISATPDVLEYLRIHRSYIIRIDQVSSKGKNWVVIKDQKIPVGKTYLTELDKIQF